MNHPQEYAKYLTIPKRLVGEAIISISHSQYFYNGEKDQEDFGDVEIHTTNDRKSCFKILGDGESVGAYEGDLNVPESFEVVQGEQASWKKLKIEYNDKVVGTQIVAIDAMYDTYPGHDFAVLAGWRIRLFSGDYFVFYNCGDNARFLFNTLPEDGGEIKTQWMPV